eukprot:scaffold108465_cov71-Phaeocystis_antarctica.AAC.3
MPPQSGKSEGGDGPCGAPACRPVDAAASPLLCGWPRSSESEERPGKRASSAVMKDAQSCCAALGMTSLVLDRKIPGASSCTPGMAGGSHAVVSPPPLRQRGHLCGRPSGAPVVGRSLSVRARWRLSGRLPEGAPFNLGPNVT